LRDVRVFGSVARGEAVETSDVDLLVAPGPDTTLFHLDLDLDLDRERLADVFGRDRRDQALRSGRLRTDHTA